MDIPCPICGEPWDNDTIHEEVEYRKSNGDAKATYSKVAQEFRSKGCVTFNGASQCKPSNSFRQQAIRMTYDLLGDDMDGAASLLDDYDYAGLLNDPEEE